MIYLFLKIKINYLFSIISYIQIYNSMFQETPYDSSTSHSVDELADYPSGQSQLWSAQRNARASELSEMTSKKHVSFDSGDTKVRRSLTCSSGIGGIPHMNSGQSSRQQHSQRNVSPPSISLTSTSSTRREMSPPVASQERLLGQISEQDIIK